jgi:hypothetical protein
MSRKHWWWRGDGNLTGTSGRDWLFGGWGNNTIDGRGGNDFIWSGRGNNTIDGGDGNDRIWSGRGHDTVDGGDGNDRIWSGRGHDTVDGGAGDDRVYGGRGNDTGVYSVAENIGSSDYYHGGRGNDLLILKMTHAEYESADVQADLLAYNAFLANQGSHWNHHSFQFKAFDLKVKNWESYEIEFTDSEKVSKNAVPEAVDDRLKIDADLVPIQETEPNDPTGSYLSATAQVIERSSFRIAPSQEVGDDSLPRVSITGTISGTLPVTGPNANDVDVFAFTLQAGETLILDIDHGFVPGSTMNAQLFLMDEGGQVLAENDNPSIEPGSTGSAADIGGTGSVSPLDPYLEFTESGSGGTYYVAVSTWNNDPLGSSGEFNDFGFVPGDYVLNVSIDNPAPDLGAFFIAPDTLLANDADADGDSLSIISVGNAVNGKVELTSSGEILFKPAANSPGSFDYTVGDGKGGESTATVTVNGNPIVGTWDKDVLTSTSEADLFVGGGESDRFEIATGTGNDTIADFTLGSDVLAITDGMSVAELQALGNDTLVYFDTGDSVLLVGVSGVTDVNDLFA